jgi:hypothetical protein
MVRTTTTRRSFLETIGGVGAAAAGTLVNHESARGYAANDTLNVACLGTGGRCVHLMKALVQVPGVRIAAVCDVYDPHLNAANPRATRPFRPASRETQGIAVSGKFPSDLAHAGVKFFTSYGDVLPHVRNPLQRSRMKSTARHRLLLER